MSKTTWLILGFIGLLMFYPEKKKIQRVSPTPDDLHGLDGNIRSCDSWFETTDKKGRNIHRCFIYSPTCSPKKCKVETLKGFTATCSKHKKRKDGSKYCSKYAPTCGATEQGCRKESAPVPGKPKRKTKKELKAEAIASEKEVLALAKTLASDANETLQHNKALMRKILSYGGIAPHASGFLREEYNELPDKYKRKGGIPLDELAQELGTDERTLTDEIYSAEESFRRLKEMKGGNTRRRFNKEDFINEAHNRITYGSTLGKLPEFSPDITKKKIRARVKNSKVCNSFFTRTSRTPGVRYVMCLQNGKASPQSVLFDKKLFDLAIAKAWFDNNIERVLKEHTTIGNLSAKIYGDDFFSPKQKELFPELRRELVLKVEDTATSEEPLEACLERKGWDLRKVKKYQESIADKMTPDMFGKMQKLTGTEVMLQENIQKCLERLRK